MTNQQTKTNYEPTGTLWACTDCMILEANGDYPPDMTEEECNDWANQRYDGNIHHYSLGRMHGDDECGEDHGDDYDAMTECETRDFSRSSCDVCDSRLGGSRHTMTGWIAVTA